MKRPLSERLFRGLLWLYPAEFRTRYQAPMMEFYRERRRGLPPGAGPRLRLWRRLVIDAVGAATAEHLRTLAERRSRRASAARLATQRKEPAMDSLLHDLRFALRGFRRAPAFTIIVLATIAIGIGANTAIFTVLEAVLIRPLPYRHAERVMAIWNGAAGDSYTAVAAPEYFDFKEQLTTLDEVAALRPQPSTIVGPEGEPDRLSGYVVTPNLFDLLGAGPAFGRAFRPGDGVPGGERVVVLSHALWQRRFGRDSAILGRELNVAGLTRIVIGVMPPEVRFPDAPVSFARERADLWIPSTLEQLRTDERGNQNLAVLGRLAAGSTREQAISELAGLADRFRGQFPDRYGKAAAPNWRLVSIPLREQMVGSVTQALVVLAVAVGLVLLIASVNVANLLLARGALRSREVAVRMALGAGRRRVLRQLLTESVLLALLGGLLGVGLAWVGTPLLLRLEGGTIPRLDGARISVGILAFSFAISLLTGLVVGGLPALRQSRAELRSAIGEGARGTSDGRSRRRLRSGLVAGQVAMALVILVAAGLLVRSFQALAKVDPGFTPDGVLSLELTVPRTSYDSASKVVDFYTRLIGDVGVAPGVSAASVIYPLPMSGEGWSGSFSVEGTDPTTNPHAEYAVAGPGYFATMRIPVLEGREFTAADRATSPAVAVVDEHLARTYWPNQSAIGKRINTSGGADDWVDVVGVVGHVHSQGQAHEGEPQLYLPLAQYPQRQMFVVARATGGSAASLAGAVRGSLRQLDPNMPGTRMAAVDDLVRRTLAPQRFNTVLIGGFAFLALGLASLGLYGVMSYLVAQRTREIGIRVALGGRPGEVRRMVLRESLAIALVGVVAGVVVSLAGSRLLAGLLFGVSATDLATYGAAVIGLLAVAAGAAYGPVRRATAIDPTVALRE